MRYLGLDVHSGATVWCLLDETGKVVGQGQLATTESALRKLLKKLTADDEIIAGQEVGTMSYFVHDALTELGVRLLSFNAQHLRMIASSRKKTDKRDAYWIAKALQTGMTPHAVYIPSGEVRRLRQLLSHRAGLLREQQRWVLRAKTHLRAAGLSTPSRTMPKILERVLEDGPVGLDERLVAMLECCGRMHDALKHELVKVEKTILLEAEHNDAIRRLQTIPAVGPWVAITIYAWVGDVSRFSSARRLTAYAGLVPSVWQSGDAAPRLGGVTKQGSPELRSMLVQAGHVLLGRCRSAEAAPLKALAARVQTSRKRRKIAVVAAARHILRIAYYVLRDGTVYDPGRLAPAPARLAAAPSEAAE